MQKILITWSHFLGGRWFFRSTTASDNRISTSIIASTHVYCTCTSVATYTGSDNSAVVQPVYGKQAFAGGLQVVYSREDTLQTQRQSWKPFQPYNVVSIVVSIYLVVIAVCALYSTAIVSRAHVKDTYAKAFTPCSKNNGMHVVVEGDILVDSATYYGRGGRMVATHNRFADPVTLSRGKDICKQGTHESRSSNAHALKAPARVTTQMRLVRPMSVGRAKHRHHDPARPVRQAGGVNYVWPGAPAGYAAIRNPSAVLHGFVNAFAYGQCTWWAAQRYFQLHSTAVPWRSGADAGQWTARAYENGWRVSRVAIVGSILVLQGGVEGAGSVGHVGIVEDVLRDGTAIASSMNWDYHGSSVTLSAFRPGPGVTFVG